MMENSIREKLINELQDACIYKYTCGIDLKDSDTKIVDNEFYIYFPKDEKDIKYKINMVSRVEYNMGSVEEITVKRIEKVDILRNTEVSIDIDKSDFKVFIEHLYNRVINI